MKLLRETIRRIILSEGMITYDQLPEDAYIQIRIRNGQSVTIQYATFDENGNLINRYDPDDECWGEVIIEKYSHEIPVWCVTESEAGDGYGPLLYDVAMEWATMNGLGLMSDRYNVSKGDDGAVNVWEYYYNYRISKDVECHQMDDMNNTLTPTLDDNIEQVSARAHSRPKDRWMDHPLSKRYTKAPVTINAMGSKIQTEA